MKYDEPIFSKNRITTTRYFLHQRFASRRPWAAPADLCIKNLDIPISDKRPPSIAISDKNTCNHYRIHPAFF